MTVTRQSVRQRLIQEAGLGLNSVATGGGATTLIDTTRLERGNADSRSFVGYWLYRPNAVNAVDKVRQVSSYTPASGTLTHQGVNYVAAPLAGGDDGVYELIKLMHPDDLNSAINRAGERIWFDQWSPLSLVNDGDMESSGVTAWTASNATLTKVTMTSAGFSPTLQRHSRVLRVANTSANGYAESNTITVAKGAFGLAFGTMAADVGTMEIVVWDKTNNAQIIALSAQQEAPHQVYTSFTVPGTCTAVALRLLGVEATADVYWDMVGLHVQNQTAFIAPSWVVRPSQILNLHQQIGIGSPMTASSGQAFYPDNAFLWPVVPIAHIEFDPPSAVNRIRIHLGIRAGPRPIWIHAIRPYSDFQLNDETTSGIMPEDWFVAACRIELYERLNGLYKGQFQAQWTQAQRQFAAISRYEAPRGELMWKPVWGGS
jgi:hypothetical protein